MRHAQSMGTEAMALTSAEMELRIRRELEAGERGGMDKDVVESIMCSLVGDWVIKGYRPPLISILGLLRDHGFYW